MGSISNLKKCFFNNYRMRLLRNRINRMRLKNKNITLISSNCNGGCILNDLGLRFNSPFVNLWIYPDDYIKLLRNIEYYMSCKMDFIREEGINYPIGMLDDIKIYFMHYETEKDALNRWNARKKRMDMDNLFILFSDRDGCTEQNLIEFDSLPHKNKVVFTHLPYKDIASAVYIGGFENESSVGDCNAFIDSISGKKYYDAFDYVKWFNKGKMVMGRK